MATTTTNLGLKKPAGTDQALISDINNNMDILDTKIGAVGSTSVQSQITSLSDQIGKIITSGSMHDIKTPGIYWLTSVVTDKPNNGAGTYIISKYSNDYLSGVYIVADDGKLYTVKYSGNAWTYNGISDKISTLEQYLLGTDTNISAYNSTSNFFTCPSDGYVYLYDAGSTCKFIRKNGYFATMAKCPSGAEISTFVKEGTKVYVTDATNASFRPFTT